MLLLLAMGLTQLELRGWEGLHVDGWAAWALLTRNLLLVALLGVVVQELRRLTRSIGASPSVDAVLGGASSASTRARSSATS